MTMKSYTQSIYIILLYPDERRPTTVRSNDTLVDTPFQLISGFFHVNQGILCSEHAEQASSRGVLERGGATTGSGLKPIRLQVHVYCSRALSVVF